jgi:hypothetical protein
MQAKTFRRAVAAAVAIFAVAAAATVALKPWTPVAMVGVATGEYVDGKPVYRLPTVSVTVSRKAELAKMEQEERAVARAASRQ